MKPLDRPPKRLLLEKAEARAAEDAATAEVLAQLVEPSSPDQLARERIWRTLLPNLSIRERRRRTPWLVVPVASAIAIVIAGAMVWLQPARRSRSPSATVRLTSGAVLVAAPRQDWSPAQSGGYLSESTRMHTEAQGQAAIAIGETRILLTSASDLGLEALGPSTFLRLTKGEVVCEVSPRKPGEAFVVQTTRYRVTVKGTVFAVRERSETDVEVSVTRGVVEVSGEGGLWTIRAGQRWHSLDPSTLGPDDIQENQRRLLDPSAAPEAPFETASKATVEPKSPSLPSAQLEKGPESPPESVERAPEKGPITRPHRAPAPSPAATEPELSRRDPSPPNAPAPPLDTKVSPPVSGPTEPLLARLDRSEPALSHSAPPASPIVTVPGTAPDSTAAAIAAVRNAPPVEAAAVLQQIIGAKGANADLALYELGRLRQLRLGDPAGALDAYRSYEKAYPRGALVQEVALSTIEIELQQENLSGALSEIDRFLSEHRSSERAPEVHLLRGDVLQKKGAAAAAVREYQNAASHGIGEIAEEGLYRSAACLSQLGQSEEARGALRRYLDRYPNGRHAAEAATALGK